MLIFCTRSLKATIVGIKRNAGRCTNKETPGIDAAKRARTWTAYKKAARKAAARPAPREGSSIPAPEVPLELEPEPELELEPLEPAVDEPLVLVAERVAVETVPLTLEEPEPVPVAEPPEGTATRVEPPEEGAPAGTVAATPWVVIGNG